MANILVIDAEPVLLDLISNVLRLDGHTVRAVSEPLAAVISPNHSDIPVDLLVTGIDMKPISGFEVVRRLRKAGFNGSVLFTCEYTGLYLVIADSLGTRWVLEKPFTGAQLRAAVDWALAKNKATAPARSMRAHAI